MPNRPPRREPRVLAVEAVGGRLSFAVADPWEIRSAGTSRVGLPALRLAVQRLLARERPTVLYARGRRLKRLLRALAGRWRVPLIGREPVFVGARSVTALYPELPLFAPTSRQSRLALAAVSLALSPDNPPRTYASHRRRPVSEPLR